MKKTDWYPESIKPTHIGTYETDLGKGAWSRYGFSYWNGRYWSNQYLSAERAEQLGSDGRRGVQDKPWRGLAEQS